jgi:uncharacterized membrane protein YkvA (DUF1232 family)
MYKEIFSMSANTNAASPDPSQSQSRWNLEAILRDFGAAWRLFWDPKVPAVLKLLLPVAALVYWVFPIDLMPGIPLDDIAILILALRLFVQLASPNVAPATPPRPTAEDDANTIDTTWRVVKNNG